MVGSPDSRPAPAEASPLSLDALEGVDATGWVVGRRLTSGFALGLTLVGVGGYLGLGEQEPGASARAAFAVILLGVVVTVISVGALNRAARRWIAIARAAEHRARFEGTLASLGEATMSVDLAGRVAFMNPLAEALTGWRAEEARGQALDAVVRLIDEQTRAAVEVPLAQVLREGLVVGLARRAVLVARDGREIPIEESGSPIRGEGPGLLGAVLLFRDVSERRRVEEALVHARDAAEAASRAKSAFLANMSHEIRTPMNAVLGYAQLLQRDPALTAVQKQYLATIRRSGDHLLDLINDVLEVAKIEAGIRRVDPGDVDLFTLLDDVERMFRVRTQGKSLAFTVRRDADVPRHVASDERRLRQILINLLANAVKFTAQGSVTTHVRTRRAADSGEWLVIEVSDTGPGIAAEELDGLFQPFAQARVGIQASGGTGLGLALSQDFARLLGGSITVDSCVGEGSTFRLEVPLVAGQVTARKPVLPSGRVLRIAGTSSGGRRVLVADDDEDSRLWLRALLEEVGFEVREAPDGAAAVAMVEGWRPNLVLLDMNMPVMDGYAAARAIRDLPAGRAVVVVAVTASAFEEERGAIFAAGANAVLAKPCREAELLDEIRRRLGLVYEYDDAVTEAEPARSSAVPEARGSAPALDPALAGEIRAAAHMADYDAVLRLLERIPAEQAPLAGTLRALVEGYDYEQIERVLKGSLGAG